MTAQLTAGLSARRIHDGSIMDLAGVGSASVRIVNRTLIAEYENTEAAWRAMGALSANTRLSLRWANVNVQE